MKKYIFILFFLPFIVAFSQEKYTQDSVYEIINQLPDFSYAGYKYGNENIPKCNYKIFDVTQFGAIPNDTISDQNAIQNVINMAVKNGSGIIFFPEGRYIVSDFIDDKKPIICSGSNIIFRGSGKHKTTIFMKNNFIATDSSKMWTTPYMFQIKSKQKDILQGYIDRNANIGDKCIGIDREHNIKKGDWISISLLSKDSNLLKQELSPYYPVDTNFKKIINNGVNINFFMEVEDFKENIIFLKTPLPYNINVKYEWKIEKVFMLQNIGIEEINFEGNWKDSFIHHRSALDDGGWSFIKTTRVAHSWVTNCNFTNCNNGLILSQSANISVLSCSVQGNKGHEAISSHASTRNFIGYCNDKSGAEHSFGVNSTDLNNVIWRSFIKANTFIESHASQPRNTLIDVVTGGINQKSFGGARENHPNHLKNLVLWNYKQIGIPWHNYEFWASNYIWCRVVMPFLVGFQPIDNTSFENKQLSSNVSFGKAVNPESLYEYQLQKRLKELPTWVKEIKKLPLP